MVGVMWCSEVHGEVRCRLWCDVQCTHLFIKSVLW